MVVAINAFPTDTPAEHEAIKTAALAAGAAEVEICTHHAEGGLGAAKLGLSRDESVQKRIQMRVNSSSDTARKR